ncbi:PTS galactitol transporter subunit IIC [Lentilactobacillus fungorum]|uniref:PTS galactitol transporter subunit IIC n=1 Tax=Lentilactobacillus fungorum TaxID=2201250 RepID=A0ABQ3W0T1_9LACO|nr:PTS transporter subunit IIC [Lentilactobacillus fungorum]GHP14142.1 PTS galactitol transporter subunit IIC [Lentilactobacillus fungorum]
MDIIVAELQWFMGLKTSVMLPILLFVFALILKLSPKKAFKAGLTIGIGFIGLDLVLGFLTQNLGLAVQSMMAHWGISLKTIDVGWPAASAIAYGTLLGSCAIPIGIISNVVLLYVGLTKTLDVDIWNYWHIAFTGSLVYVASQDFYLGILTMIVHTMIIYLLADLSAPYVQRQFGLAGISFPQGASVPGYLIALPLNWVMDRIPGINRIKIDAKTIQKRLGLFGDPLILGSCMGIIIGIFADYSISRILELGVSTAAFLVLMPRMVSLLMEGLAPISERTNLLVKSHFTKRQVYVGMDSALAAGNATVLSTALILVPISLIMAVIVPGNHVLPFGDLVTFPYMIAVMAAVFRGNLFRTLIGGGVSIVISLYAASWLAPIISAAAHGAKLSLPANASISVLSDGGVWTTWLMVALGKTMTWGGIGLIGLVTLLIMIWYNKFHISSSLKRN